MSPSQELRKHWHHTHLNPQNCELNKPLFFIKYKSSSILFYQHKTDWYIYILSHSICTVVLGGRHYHYVYFADEKLRHREIEDQVHPMSGRTRTLIRQLGTELRTIQ
jgi:hypothetical protein